jgi:hypothetical protein
MKHPIALVAVIVLSISGCGGGKNFQERRNRLMYECQCEPGTYEYEYRLAGLFIEEQYETKNYLESNKDKFLECVGMTDGEHKVLLQKVDEGIDFNKSARPSFFSKLFRGDSQTGRIYRYKEAYLDLIAKDLEKACAQSQSKDASVNSGGSGAQQGMPSVPDSTPQPLQGKDSAPETKSDESAPSLMGDRIDEQPNAEPNTEEDAANKLAKKSWQDGNGLIHHPDGSVSSHPVD